MYSCITGTAAVVAACKNEKLETQFTAFYCCTDISILVFVTGVIYNY